MKKFMLFLFFTLSSFLTFSQYIEGKVVDATTNKPIEGVHVFMKGINRGTLTNEKGNYYLKFPYKMIKSDIIRFSHIAYEELEIPYVSSNKNYKVYLKGDLKKLKEVKISGKINFKKIISYKKLSPMKNGVHSFGSVLNDGKIYVIGGDASYKRNDLKKMLSYDDPDKPISDFFKTGNIYSKESYKGDFQVYDVASDTWSIDKLKFKKRAYHAIHFYKNNLYILGGKNLSPNGKFEYLDDKIEVYDIENNTIKIDNTNPHQTASFASFTYKDNIIVMGGSTKINNFGVKQYSNKIHFYNLKTGNWFQLGSMPIAKEPCGVLIDDKIYLIGGFNNKPLLALESFDLITQKWKKEGELFYGVSKPAITHKENIIYFFNDGKINTYNIITKELNEYFIDLSLEASELYYANNKLYILGGLRSNTYSQFPSKGLFSIDISEFNNTRIHNSKIL
ncbi:MAG: carboxypeptidase-like regulatory domain-containing protein [Lutibacter sp.]|uniref:Kelch repeat-containing protein n=1 Tax=Lutibacter sp. TaxID=1925666 RepID=UPI00385FA1DD